MIGAGCGLPGAEISYHARRDQVDIEVGERHTYQAEPRERHMPLVQPRRSLPQPNATRRPADKAAELETHAYQVTPGMAARGVAGQQCGVDQHDYSADSDAELTTAKERCQAFLPEEYQQQQCSVQRVAVEILKHEQRCLPSIPEGRAT